MEAGERHVHDDEQLRGFALAEHWLDVDQAHRALDALATAEVEDPHTWRLRAVAYHELDEHERCIAAGEAGLLLEPDDPALLQVVASAHRELGELAVADSTIVAALHVDPQNPSLHCEYARILIESHQLPRAEEAVAHAARLSHPDDIQVLFLRASVAYEQGRPRDGLPAVERILELDPGNPYAQAMLGALKSHRSWPSQWAPHMQSAARENPGNPGLVEAAREAQLVSHPLMAPLWPVERFGWVAVTVAGIATSQVCRHVVGGTLGAVVAATWFVYCVYSWTAPRLLRRWLRRGT